MRQGVTSRLIGWLGVSALVLCTAQAGARESASIEGHESERYVADLRALYLTSSPREALLAHSNDLLATYALRADYQVGQVSPQGRRYQLSLGQPGELRIREELRAGDGPEVAVRNRRLTVFGLDPFMRYECLPETIQCTFLHPADGSPLFSILRDAEGAEELAKAMTFLIRDLQEG